MNVPSSWYTAEAADLCVKIQDGTHFSPKGQEREGAYPYVTAKNVRPWGLDLDDLTYLDEATHRTIYARCDVREGDVLLVKDGVNAGDAALNTIKGEISLLSSVAFLRPGAIITAPYLRYYLQSPQGRRHMLGSLSGTAIRRIILQRLRTLPVLVAPFPDQHRIVAAIETHFSRLDAAVASLTRAKANVKRARASVLKAAVEGRLVPTEAVLARADGRPYEPASVLLDRILAERKAAWAASGARGRYQEPVKPDPEGLPALPEGWCWTTLGQAFVVEVGATPSRQRPDYWGGDIAWVSSGEVQFCRIKRARETITAEGLRNTSTKVHPKGTVLLGMIGQGRTRGQAAILDVEACNNQNCAAIRVSEAGCVPEYVYGWLELQYDETRRLGGGNNQQALNKARVEAIPLPLPPLAEQHRIVAEVDRRLSVFDALDTTLDANLARCARLRQAILKRAFEGRLVPAEAPAAAPLLAAEPQAPPYPTGAAR